MVLLVGLHYTNDLCYSFYTGHCHGSKLKWTTDTLMPPYGFIRLAKLVILLQC